MRDFKRMRKILEERLENAKLDYQRCFEEIDYPLFKVDVLQGQIEVYQDCLNLLPPARTEQDILNEFNFNGYIVSFNDANYMILLHPIFKERIEIDKDARWYQTVDDDSNVNIGLDMRLHKLLHELFTLWGWI